MNLSDIIIPTLREHASLVHSGLSSQEALNIITHPMEANNLKDSLHRLTTDQATELVESLEGNLYTFTGKKAVYRITGLTQDFDGFYLWFTDCAIGIDSFSKSVEELSSYIITDLLKAINKVI